MDTRLGVDGAWDAIDASIEEGNFVPVLGFDIAASTTYADVREGGVKDLKPENVSAQHVELARVAARLANLKASLEGRSHVPPNSDDEGQLAGNYLADMTTYYVGKYGLINIEDQAVIGVDPLFDFQASIARLAAALTVTWAASLQEVPKPVSTTYTSHVARVGGSDPAIGLMRKALDACLSLALAGLEGPTLNGEQVGLIYCKLMRLASVMTPNGEDLWADSQFRNDHRPVLNRHTRSGKSTGWEDTLGAAPQPVHGTRSGIGMAHLFWLEELLRYTLLSGTRAHRRRSELAFAISLDDAEMGIPRLPADAFEIGLLYSPASDHDMRFIDALLHFCAARPDGGPRAPGGFHRLLATICRQTVDRLRLKGRLEADKQILITLGMDQELERAIEEQFDAYRVLIPVSVIIRNAEDHRAPPGEGASRRRIVRPTWLLGKVSRGRSGFETEWVDASRCATPAIDIAGAGPLIIKLFGSPMHELPDAASLADCDNLDPEAPKPNPRHRLVLDEMSLMNVLFRLYPDGSHVNGLTHRLAASRLFFFGQDAVTWGDRIPYLIVDAIRDSSDRDAAAESRPPVAGWGIGSSAASRGRRHGAVAIGKADEAARGVLRRLGVIEVDAQHASPAQVLNRLATEFGSQRPGGRS